MACAVYRDTSDIPTFFFFFLFFFCFFFFFFFSSSSVSFSSFCLSSLFLTSTDSVLVSFSFPLLACACGPSYRTCPLVILSLSICGLRGRKRHFRHTDILLLFLLLLPLLFFLFFLFFFHLLLFLFLASACPHFFLLLLILFLCLLAFLFWLVLVYVCMCVCVFVVIEVISGVLFFLLCMRTTS